MTLYHFTARRFVRPIRNQGINRGFVLITESPLRFDTAFRWLTTNPDFAQEWAEGTGRLPYRCNEVRMTVEVPESAVQHVYKWTTVGPIMSFAYSMLSAYGDPQNWRLFRGDIPRDWIVAVDENTAPSRASDPSAMTPEPNRSPSLTPPPADTRGGGRC